MVSRLIIILCLIVCVKSFLPSLSPHSLLFYNSKLLVSSDTEGDKQAPEVRGTGGNGRRQQQGNRRNNNNPNNRRPYRG